MSGAPDVAVVLVATDEGPLLLDAVASLKTSAHSRLADVVVVDNASRDDGPGEASRRWGVRVVRRSRRERLPANLNAGMAATTAPYVMVCNPDILFLPGAVDTLAAWLDRRPMAAVAGPRLLSPRGESWRSARRWYDLRSLLALRWPGSADPLSSTWARRSLYAEWDFSAPRAVDWVPLPATMLRREAIDAVGGFDERFRAYFDDVDLALRLANAGWEVWCVPDAKVVHLWRLASRAPLSPAWFLHLESLIRFAGKHRGLAPRGGSPGAARDRACGPASAGDDASK